MVKLYLIRHAESLSNKMKEDIFKMFKISMNETKLCLAYKLIKDNDVIDSLLSEKGKEQCKETRENNMDKIGKITHVIASPLRRCLETARIILDTKKLKDEGKVLDIRGEVRELLCCQGDFPMMVKESMESFREFDFASIEEEVDRYGEFFFVNYLENQRTKSDILDYLEQMEDDTTKDTKVDFLLDLLKKRLMENHLLEKNHDIYVRTQKFKKQLKEYIKKNNIKDGQLVIVTHMRIIKAWTAKDFNEKTDEYVDFIDPENACFLEVELDA